VLDDSTSNHDLLTNSGKVDQKMIVSRVSVVSAEQRNEGRARSPKFWTHWCFRLISHPLRPAVLIKNASAARSKRSGKSEIGLAPVDYVPASWHWYTSFAFSVSNIRKPVYF
jgi:hypothetical protein